MGFKSVALVGHENYYPRFGYELANEYRIGFPFEAPEINCMVVELEEGGLKGVSGMVEFSSAFLA